VDVKVEERARLAPGLIDDEVIEGAMLAEHKVNT